MLYKIARSEGWMCIAYLVSSTARRPTAELTCWQYDKALDMPEMLDSRVAHAYQARAR